MTNFDKYIIERLKQIGFEFHREYNKTDEGRPMAGNAIEYKYYPKYLDNKHYTLLLFETRNWVDINFEEIDKMTVDHRMYIHLNDGRFSQSLYQICSDSEWQKNFILDSINKLFASEIRNQKINKLINENK